MGDPARDESMGNSLCGDIRDDDAFWPSGGAIDAGKEVGIYFSKWKWSNEVKASIRVCEGRQWSNGLAVNLQALTL